MALYKHNRHIHFMFRQRPARQLVGAALWCRWSTYTPSGKVSPINYSGYFKMKVKLKMTFICSIWHNSLFVFRQLFGKGSCPA